MRLFLLLFTIVTIASCSQHEQQVYIEPELNAYWTQFQIEAERLGITLPNKNVIMALKSMDGLNGLCYNGDPNKPTTTIYIDPALFQNNFIDYSVRVEATVFHELAHGLFNKQHNKYYYDSAYYQVGNWTGWTSKTVPTSLLTEQNYYKYWTNGQWREYYLKELFGLIDDYEIYAKEHGYTIKELQY